MPAAPTGGSTYARCEVCESLDRLDIEVAYITGDRYSFPFSRGKIERHMAHISEPEAMRLALGMSAATSLAVRLRYLETQATMILDAAVRPGPDGEVNANLALKAIREVRATIELMGRVAGSLVDRVAVDQARPDLDDAIAAALAAKGTVSKATDPDPAYSPNAQPRERVLALMPGDTE